MKKELIEKTTLQLLKENNLEDWSVSFLNWKTTAAGLCCCEDKEISFSLFFAHKLPKKTFLNIIKHEVAHAIVGCDEDHNKIWRDKCLELGGTGKIHEYVEDPIRKKYSKYQSYCKICKTTYYWYRQGEHWCCDKKMKNILK